MCSLDDGGPEACRNASLPASLAVQPAYPVRPFEQVALTRSASRTSVEDDHRSVATASLRFPAALADRPGLLSGRSPACGSPCSKLRLNVATPINTHPGDLFSCFNGATAPSGLRLFLGLADSRLSNPKGPLMNGSLRRKKFSRPVLDYLVFRSTPK